MSANDKIYAFARLMDWLSRIPGLQFLQKFGSAARTVSSEVYQAEAAKRDLDNLRGK